MKLSPFRRNHSEKSKKQTSLFFPTGLRHISDDADWRCDWTGTLSSHLPTFSSLGFYTMNSEGSLEETLRRDELCANAVIAHITVQDANLTSFFSTGHNESTYHTEVAVHAGVGLEFLGLRGKRRKKIQFGNREISRFDTIRAFVFLFSQSFITLKRQRHPGLS